MIPSARDDQDQRHEGHEARIDPDAGTPLRSVGAPLHGARVEGERSVEEELEHLAAVRGGGDEGGAAVEPEARGGGGGHRGVGEGATVLGGERVQGALHPRVAQRDGPAVTVEAHRAVSGERGGVRVGELGARREVQPREGGRVGAVGGGLGVDEQRRAEATVAGEVHGLRERERVASPGPQRGRGDAEVSVGELREAVGAAVGDEVSEVERVVHRLQVLVEEVGVLGAREHLRPTLDLYRSGSVGGTDPYRRGSLAATVGWSASAALSGSPSPLSRELDAARPRAATVMFGTNDIQSRDIFRYGANLLDITDQAIARGVIPILSTVPPRDDNADADLWVPRYNAVVLGVARIAVRVREDPPLGGPTSTTTAASDTAATTRARRLRPEMSRPGLSTPPMREPRPPARISAVMSRG